MALALAAGCSDTGAAAPPPFDRFLFPTGLAVRTLPDGRTNLVVVSSNSDLRYSQGTVLSVDPDASGDARLGDLKLATLGSAAIESFGGEIGLTGSCGAGAYALTVSRTADAAYRITMGDDGSLACGAGCAIPLDPNLADPYTVTVACHVPVAASTSSPPPAPFNGAYVGYLRTPNADGWVTEIDLDRSAVTQSVNLGVSPVRSGAYDAARALLFLTSDFGASGVSPLRWLDLLHQGAPALGPQSVDFSTTVRGAVGRGAALSTDGTRLYVALQIYDADAAAASGILNFVSGALAVLDVTPLASGAPRAEVLRVVPVDLGPTEVRVIPRSGGGRDLVAVSCTDGNRLDVYDDGSGTVVQTVGVDPALGTPILGRQPYGLAVETASSRCSVISGCARLFVGSFDQGFVTVAEVDPGTGVVAIVKQIGRQR